jgi:hypothetical protein
MNLPFETDFYLKLNSSWPKEGKFILGSYTNLTVVVYQAYKPSIAQWAVQHKTFLGCKEFSLTRMTWIKTNFLWMMYRCGWASKKDQERVLAIVMKRSGFEKILREAKSSHSKDKSKISSREDKPSGSNSNAEQHLQADEYNVRLQWDPDHDPYGEKVTRRAIQLGIRGKVLEMFLSEWIVDICDITDFVHEQARVVLSRQLSELKVPCEKVYHISEDDEELAIQIGLDEVMKINNK